MARFRTDGIDDIIEQMKALGELSGEVADEMLLRAAEEVKKAWRQAARQHKLKLTGQLIDSIGYPCRPKTVGDVRTIDIYPQGNSTYTIGSDGKRVDRKKTVRNAEVAFILHYGTSKKPATFWVDTADELAAVPVQEAMEEIWDRELRKRGLI
jgi:hypothetical protein